MAALKAPEAFAAFWGRSNVPDDRVSLYRDHVRARLSGADAEFWDAHMDTIRAGLVLCGGADRIRGAVREELPATDLPTLAAAPGAVAAAARAGVTEAVMVKNAVVMPVTTRAAMAPLVRTAAERSGKFVRRGDARHDVPDAPQASGVQRGAAARLRAGRRPPALPHRPCAAMFCRIFFFFWSTFFPGVCAAAGCSAGRV